MTDIAGNELKLGDKVAYTVTPNKNNALTIGYVTGFTPKKITIASAPDGPSTKPHWIDPNIKPKLIVDCKFPFQVAKLFI